MLLCFIVSPLKFTKITAFCVSKLTDFKSSDDWEQFSLFHEQQKHSYNNEHHKVGDDHTKNAGIRTFKNGALTN